jgi:hypothetical protein
VHGDFKTEDGYTLGVWVSMQRSTRSTLTAERVTRLDALGFVWDARSEAYSLTVSGTKALA